MGRDCRPYGREQKCMKALERKPEGNTLLGRPRRRMLDNIEKNLGKIGWRFMDWIVLAQDRSQWLILVNTASNLRVPYNSRNFVGGRETDRFLRRTQINGNSSNGNSCMLRLKTTHGLFSITCYVNNMHIASNVGYVKY
jgi:hypothetical protein